MDETPDGREIWLVQSFPSVIVPPPTELGYILIVDAVTGVALDTVRTIGLRVGQPTWPLPIALIAFHPSGEKAYVTSYRSEPAFLVVDAAGRLVQKTLYGDVYTNVLGMALSRR